FAASLDADSEGEEGLFYTWSREEIDTALGEDSARFHLSFTLDRPAAWEGKPVIRQTDAQQAAELADENTVATLKQKLLAMRESRIRPGPDGKVLTDWNGLAIAALAECGRTFSRRDWIEAAATAFHHIASGARDGRLAHSMLDGQKLFPALSSDYAAFANAAISLHEATGDPAYAAKARHYLDQLDRWHADATGESHYLTASDAADVPIRIRGDVDEAIPSAMAQIVEAFVRLATLTGDGQLQQRAWAVAEHAAGRAAHQPYGQAGIVNSCALALQPMKLLVIDDAEAPSLVPVANRNPDPRRVDIFVPVGTAADPSLLPGGTLPRTDRPGAYLCTGQTCLPPIADPVELEEKLRPGQD
ncbi:MAG TPA: thioredoxin domain-containing protein, partial [Mesorhizobium sp.]|nr:thioredoxin domain-containing protein [Mesorhizobium sp.]